MRNTLILLLVCFSGALWAQGSGVEVQKRPVSEAQWEQAAEDLDYSHDLPKAEKKKNKQESDAPSVPNPFQNFDGQFWGNLFQILAILVAVAAIGYGVFRMLQQPRNKRIARDGAEITVDNLETYLHETDLDRFLREALAKQDFSQAIRIYFLQIIKQLSESGGIHWSIEKTNRDYLREMRVHPEFQTFQGLTRTYERVWYGNVTLDAAGFEELEPGFRGFREAGL